MEFVQIVWLSMNPFQSVSNSFWNNHKTTFQQKHNVMIHRIGALENPMLACINGRFTQCELPTLPWLRVHIHRPGLVFLLLWDQAGWCWCIEAGKLGRVVTFLFAVIESADDDFMLH